MNGSDRDDKPGLAQLLRQLGKVDGLQWIRRHYTYPSAFDDDLISDTVQKLPTNRSNRSEQVLEGCRVNFGIKTP